MIARGCNNGWSCTRVNYLIFKLVCLECELRWNMLLTCFYIIGLQVRKPFVDMWRAWFWGWFYCFRLIQLVVAMLREIFWIRSFIFVGLMAFKSYWLIYISGAICDKKKFYFCLTFVFDFFTTVVWPENINLYDMDCHFGGKTCINWHILTFSVGCLRADVDWSNILFIFHILFILRLTFKDRARILLKFTGAKSITFSCCLFTVMDTHIC